MESITVRDKFNDQRGPAGRLFLARSGMSRALDQHVKVETQTRADIRVAEKRDLRYSVHVERQKIPGADAPGFN
ncbi:hypothetical protein RA28_20355 [Ruegeria sp. ANG-S4]|nr:hypothetical protein RA28_20355 [Ruegeria sp. ANG-S4]